MHVIYHDQIKVLLIDSEYKVSFFFITILQILLQLF